jgi:hypothetical protein
VRLTPIPIQVSFWESWPGLGTRNADGSRNPLGRIVGYARKCQLVSTPEIPACGKCAGLLKV